MPLFQRHFFWLIFSNNALPALPAALAILENPEDFWPILRKALTTIGPYNP